MNSFYTLHLIIHWMAANMYSEMREEARDHARLRNVYFEQVGLKFYCGFRWHCIISYDVIIFFGCF